MNVKFIVIITHLFSLVQDTATRVNLNVNAQVLSNNIIIFVYQK